MIHMNDADMDHRDRLRENLAVLGVERLSSFKVLGEFGKVVDRKFPVRFISRMRLLHIYISWLYDRLTDIDLSDENAARDEIRSWLAYLRGCYISDDLLADAFKNWEAEHVKVDPSSSRRLRFAWIELDEMLNFEQHESGTIQTPREEINDEHSSSSGHDSLSPHHVDKAVPSSEVDDGNGVYFFDTVGHSRSIGNETATCPRESKAEDQHWGAIHPDRLIQSQQEAENPSAPTVKEFLASIESPLSFLTGANQLVYQESVELASGRKSDTRRTPVVHHSPGRLTLHEQRNSQQKSNLPKVPTRSEKKSRGQHLCKRCNVPGHVAETCPTILDPRYDNAPGEGYLCSWCNKPGHYSTVCPKNTLEDSINQRRIRAGIIQSQTTLDLALRSSKNLPQRESWRGERVQDRGDERTRDRGDRYTRRRSPHSIDEPRHGRQRSRSTDRYQSYRTRSPLGDRSYSHRSSGAGRDRYARRDRSRSRSPRNIEHGYRYDAAERSPERRREERSRERRRDEPFREPRREGFQQAKRSERLAKLDKPWKFKEDIRQPLIPKFQDDIRQPPSNTFLAEDRSQEGRPREHTTPNYDAEDDRSQEHKTEEPVADSKTAAPTFKGAFGQPVGKINAEDLSQKDKPVEQDAYAKIMAPDVESIILDQPDSTTDTESRPQEDKVSEQDTNTKTAMPALETILQLMTDEKRLYKGSSRFPKQNPPDFGTYNEYDEELYKAWDDFSADDGRAVMFSGLSFDDSPIPRHTTGPVELGVGVQSLDGFHPKVQELFRNRKNVWLHQVKRNRAKDFFWSSTSDAGPGEKATLAMDDPNSRASGVNDTGMTGYSIVQESMDEPDSHANEVNDTNLTGDDIQHADIYIPASTVDLETMDYGLSLGATIEVGNDSFTDKGDSVEGDNLPLESPNGVGEDDSFTEKGDSVMEDVESLQLEEVE